MAGDLAESIQRGLPISLHRYEIKQEKRRSFFRREDEAASL